MTILEFTAAGVGIILEERISIGSVVFRALVYPVLDGFNLLEFQC